MQTSKRLKIYCALLFVMTIMVSTIASVGTSYAHFVYTGEHQVVLHKAEETRIESNIMFPQGCTVVLKEWNMNSSCEAQTISASFSGKEGKGKISCSIPQEYAKYYTIGITDAEGVNITENDEVLVSAEGTELIITVTPVTEKLSTLATEISAEALLTFTELTETTSEDGTATVTEGDKLTGTLKWNVIPLDEPLPEQPTIPTATVTEIANEELIFALNFKADEVTEEQLNFYGSWYADFELKVNKDVTFNADGSADGWLSGQYDAWSENWVNVPFENVTLAANTPLKIMEYAAELMGQPGLKYTYAEVYEGVKEFNCGVFFDKEFLAANPDLEVTLELRMYNPADEKESYVIGETYIFTYTAPPVPTAVATEIVNEDLTFAMNFKADEATAEQLNYYGSWYTDYEITLNKDITFHGNGSADGWLSGQLDAWSENWVKIPLTAITLTAGQPFKIMEYASVILNKPDYRYTYAEVYEGIKDFDCGVFFNDAYLTANPDLEVKLELKMYNPADESKSYLLGETYIFKAADLDTSTEEQEPQQTAEPVTVCAICNSAEHTTENHPAEETVACTNCGETGHTAENCVTEINTEETETSENEENSTISEANVTEEIETMAYNALYAVTGVQLNTETAGVKAAPMLFTFVPVLTTVDEIPQVSPTPSVAADNTTAVSKTANASHVSIIDNTDIVTYTYITYPAGTQTVEITDFANVVVDEGTRYVYSFTPYTQVHTEEMIYVLPYGNSFTIETDPLVAGTLSLKIVSKDANVQQEETETIEEVTETTEEETETSTETEEIIFTSKAVKWKFNDGTNMFQTSENICYAVEGSDFDNNAPLAEILSAEGPVAVKIMPETDGKTVYSIEYYSKGTYTTADLEDFSVEIDNKTNIMKIDVGEHYPQAGIYRVCLQLQPNNKLSAYYKTFFVNYR